MEVVDLPTNDYDPVEAAIRQRDENILFNTNHHEADDNLKIPSGFNSFRPMGYIGVDPSKDCNGFYNSYETLVSSVQEILTSGLRIIYNLYQGFIKFKSVDPTKYSLIMKKGWGVDKSDPWAQFDELKRVSVTKNNLEKNADDSDNIESYVNFDKFIEFYSVFKKWAPSSDIAFALTRDEYIDEITKLRLRLSELCSEYDICVDIENSSDYPKSIPNPHNNIIFKVRPILNTIIKSKTNDTIPSCNYKVLFDLESIIEFMITGRYFKLPDELPPAQEDTSLEIDSYVTQQLVNVGNLSELLAKKVILELCDNAHNINGNWVHFIKKFMNTYESNKANSDIINLNSKLNYLLGEQKQDDSEEVVDVVVTKIFDYIVKHPNDNFGTFLTQLQNAAVNYLDDTENETYIKLIAVIFKKAFSHYFEDSVLLRVYKNNSVFYSNEYCREFNRKYNIEEMLAYINRVNDYNIRDFFETLIKDNINNKLINFDTRKLPNGENVSFLYSKFRRQYVLHVASLLLIARSFYNKAKSINFDLENRMHRTISSHVYNLIDNIIYLVRSISNEVGIILNQTDARGSDKFPILNKLISFCKKYIFLPSWKNCVNCSEKYKELNEMFRSYISRYYTSSTARKYDNRADECLWPIYSYDSSDLSDRFNDSDTALSSTKVIFDNIIKGLIESGELNIENHCYLY